MQGPRYMRVTPSATRFESCGCDQLQEGQGTDVPKDNSNSLGDLCTCDQRSRAVRKGNFAMKTVRNGRHYAFAQTLEVPKALKLPYSRVGSFVTSAALAVTSIILAQYGFGQVGSTADNTGVQPFQSYLNDKETINLATGGVNVRIPLLHLPGRAGHDLDFAINFNSQSRFSLGLGSGPVICTGDTTPQTCPNGVVPGITQYYLGYGPTPGSNGWTTTMPSIGFSNLQIGTEQSGGTQGGYVGGPVLTGDHGETVTFGLQSQWMTSGSNFSPIASTAADDQGQDVVASSPGDGSLSFYFPDGRRLVAPASAASGGYYSEILDVDRNGNSITYNINNITDTLGRVVSFTYPSSTAGEGALMMSSMLWASSLQYMNSNGKAETITFIYGNSPLAPSATVDQPTFGSSSTAFYCTNVAEQYPQPPSACVTWMGTGQAVTSSPSTAINLSQTSLSAIVLPNLDYS